MQFTTDRLERLERSLQLALNQEWPQLSATQKRLAKVRPTPISARLTTKPLAVVATVATDGGENRLSLEPIQVQVIRVADSLGEVYFEDFIAQSLSPEEILSFFFKSNERLNRFLAYLQLEWNELLRGETVPLMPVDVANWQRERVDEAMTLLYQSAHASFPLRGYPQPLVQAHEHARLGGLEMEMFEQLLLQQVAKRDPAVALTARQLMLLGKQLSQPVDDED